MDNRKIISGLIAEMDKISYELRINVIRLLIEIEESRSISTDEKDVQLRNVSKMIGITSQLIAEGNIWKRDFAQWEDN